MYYTLYKITNTITNRIYVGVHQTNDLGDGYMGSGTLLKRSQQKHGIENFEKEILGVFDSCEDMMQAESVVVNEEFVSSKETYNLVEGGGRIDNLKEHSYYKSGDHANNTRAAQKCAVAKHKKLKEQRIQDYNNSPTVCKYCESPLPYNKKRNKFCNNSCATSFNNKGRFPLFKGI